MRAYHFFEKRGCEAGHDLDDWLQAEAKMPTSCMHPNMQPGGRTEIFLSSVAGDLNNPTIGIALIQNFPETHRLASDRVHRGVVK